jgi:hypothetical protein
MYKALQLLFTTKIFTDEKDNCKQRNYQAKFLTILQLSITILELQEEFEAFEDV